MQRRSARLLLPGVHGCGWRLLQGRRRTVVHFWREHRQPSWPASDRAGLLPEGGGIFHCLTYCQPGAAAAAARLALHASRISRADLGGSGSTQLLFESPLAGMTALAGPVPLLRLVNGREGCGPAAAWQQRGGDQRPIGLGRQTCRSNPNPEELPTDSPSPSTDLLDRLAISPSSATDFCRWGSPNYELALHPDDADQWLRQRFAAPGAEQKPASDP